MTGTRSAASVALTAVLALAGCTSAQPPADGGTPTSGGTGTAAPPGPGGTRTTEANGYEGSVHTSGLYDANWTVPDGQSVEVFNSVANPSLTSDKGTYGNLKVDADGSVSFGSGAPELSSAGGQFNGTGAKVTLDSTGQFVCAFTVDTDLVASGGAKLHIAGTMAVHWHPEGLGGLNCP